MPSTVDGKTPVDVGVGVGVGDGDSAGVDCVGVGCGVALGRAVGVDGVLVQPMKVTSASIASDFFISGSLLRQRSQWRVVAKT
jgi:hypothetical protein